MKKMYTVKQEQPMTRTIENGKIVTNYLVHITVDTIADIPEVKDNWLAGSRCDVLENSGHVYELSHNREWVEVNFYNLGGGSDSTDLSNYYTMSQTDEKITEKIASLENYDDSELKSEIAINRSSLGLQKKNYIKIIPSTGTTRSGITFTPTGDGGVHTVGTATADTYFVVCSNSNFSVPNDNYFLSFTTSEDNSGGECYVGYYNSSKNYFAEESEDKLINHNDTEYSWNFAVRVHSGATVDNIIYPMLRKTDVTDNTFEPYVDDLQTQINSKVDKVSGMGLSQNSFTTSEKTKLANLENYDDSQIKSEIAETAEQIALNYSTLGYQKKNLLKNNYVSKKMNDVTVTVNADGSIVVSGISNKNTDFILLSNMSTGLDNQFTNNKKFIPNGKYILSGGVVGCGVQVVASEDNTSATTKTVAVSFGKDVAFTIDDSNKYVWFRIVILSDADFSKPVTIYPMVRDANIKDSSYEPYVDDLQTQIEKLTARITVLETN